MIRLLFESYFKDGKSAVTPAEFTEFMQTAIPAFHLEKLFKSDTESIKKVSLLYFGFSIIYPLYTFNCFVWFWRTLFDFAIVIR